MKHNQGKGGLFGRIWRGGVVLTLLGIGVAVVAGMAGSYDLQVFADGEEEWVACP